MGSTPTAPTNQKPHYVVFEMKRRRRGMNNEDADANEALYSILLCR